MPKPTLSLRLNEFTEKKLRRRLQIYCRLKNVLNKFRTMTDKRLFLFVIHIRLSA